MSLHLKAKSEHWLYNVFTVSYYGWLMDVCVCVCVFLFPERVTICEGGVDISDSDDEDESRCRACIKWFVQKSKNPCCACSCCFAACWSLQSLWRMHSKTCDSEAELPSCSYFLSTNELTLSSPFDLLRPSQELQSVSWGTAAHHQIRSIVSHLLFCHFLSSCLGFSVLTHQT